MRYDVNLIHELCREIGLSSRMSDDQGVEIDLGRGAVLCFENNENDDDCLMGFSDTPWHTHGHIMFADAQGSFVELEYLDVLVGLKDGHVLVCERMVSDHVADRWLIHHKYNDEFRYMEQGEQIVVRRAALASPKDTTTR
jgi:hypothetical protein